MKTTTYTFRLDLDLKAELDKYSTEMQMSSAKFVRKAIRHYIMNHSV